MNVERPAYWLTPVIDDNPLTLGRERISLPSSAELSEFRAKLTALHPWLLPLFKAHLLPSDENEDACGTDDDLPFDLSSGVEIRFDGEQLILSHCAQAFLSRLLPTAEMQALLAAVESPGTWTASQRTWLSFVSGWTRQGFPVVIVKEE